MIRLRFCFFGARNPLSFQLLRGDKLGHRFSRISSDIWFFHSFEDPGNPCSSVSPKKEIPILSSYLIDADRSNLSFDPEALKGRLTRGYLMETCL